MSYRKQNIFVDILTRQQVFNAIEGADTTKAWTFISNAANLCQTLGYHRYQPSKQIDEHSRTAQARLFWTVYRLEKGLSFRLGRPSTIRDEEITLPIDSSDEALRVTKLQSRIYDQLYSVVGLSRSSDDRGALARILATELEGIISETRVNTFVRRTLFNRYPNTNPN